MGFKGKNGYILRWVLEDENGKPIMKTNAKQRLVEVVFRKSEGKISELKKSEGAAKAYEVTYVSGVWIRTGRVE